MKRHNTRKGKGSAMGCYVTSYVGMIGNRDVVAFAETLNKSFVEDNAKDHCSPTAIGRLIFGLEGPAAAADIIIPESKGAYFLDGSRWLHPQVMTFVIKNFSGEAIEEGLFARALALDSDAIVLTQWTTEYGLQSGVRAIYQGLDGRNIIEARSIIHCDPETKTGRTKQLRQLAKLRKGVIKDLRAKKPSFDPKSLFDFGIL